MPFSRSTLVLICFLVIVGIGAIIVAREFRVKLQTPMGLRIASEQRFKVLHRALLAYRASHEVYPDSRLSLMRDQHISIGAAAGITYREPAAAADPATVIFWRDGVLPGAQRGEPWSGRDQLASEDMPAIGHAYTLGGTLLAIPGKEFPAAKARWEAVDLPNGAQADSVGTATESPVEAAPTP